MKLSEELKTKSLDETLTEHNLTLAEAFQLSLKKQPTETKESIIHKEEKIEPIKEIEIVKPKKKITIIKK